MVSRQEAADYRKAWYRYFLWWQRITWLLLLVISAGSAIVASSVVESPFKDWLALVVAVAGSVFATLGPSHRADAYREAWVLLNTAVMRGVDVLEAYEEGEAIIGRKQPASK